jgi:hypothetical protein
MFVAGFPFTTIRSACLPGAPGSQEADARVFSQKLCAVEGAILIPSRCESVQRTNDNSPPIHRWVQAGK